MRKIILALATMGCVAFTTSVSADVVLPKECVKPLSSEYSTGGGKTAFHLIEVFCELEGDKWATYTAAKSSVGSWLGFGRHTSPVKLVFRKGKHSGKIIWEQEILL